MTTNRPEWKLSIQRQSVTKGKSSEGILEWTRFVQVIWPLALEIRASPLARSCDNINAASTRWRDRLFVDCSGGPLGLLARHPNVLMSQRANLFQSSPGCGIVFSSSRRWIFEILLTSQCQSLIRDGGMFDRETLTRRLARVAYYARHLVSAEPSQAISWWFCWARQCARRSAPSSWISIAGTAFLDVKVCAANCFWRASRIPRHWHPKFSMRPRWPVS